MVVRIGAQVPRISEQVPQGPHALVFYKVTCPTCQMAADPLSRFEDAYPGAVIGVGQDPQAALEDFSSGYGLRMPSVSDSPPYEKSVAYGIEHVPTMVVVDSDGKVADVVESWDRDGYNRASGVLAELLGAEPALISDPGDGLPDFRPG
jgi:peroxiredoxin